MPPTHEQEKPEAPANPGESPGPLAQSGSPYPLPMPYRIQTSPLQTNALRALRGFTLVELMVVLLLFGLLIVISLTAGGLMFRDSEQLKEQARKMAGYLENIRSLAAMKGSKYVVEYSLDDDNQGYFAWVPADANTIAPEAIFEEDEQGIRVAGGFHSMPTRYRANRSRYYAVWIDRIAFGDGTVVENGEVRVDFRPRGGSHWHYVYITNTNGDFFTIEINPFTGAADVYPGELVPEPPEEVR